MATLARWKALFGSAWHVQADAISAELASDSTGGVLVATSLDGNAATLPITGLAAAQGGSATLKGGPSATAANPGGAANLIGGVPGATGVGGAANVTGGIGGATSGNGGPANVAGGAATNGNGNGGSVVLSGGAKNGTGIAGGVRTVGLAVMKQTAPVAKTVSATLTVAELVVGILTGLQGGAAAATYTMPLGTDLDLGLPADFAVDDSFDFSIINISVVAAETITLAANAGVTMVGDLTLACIAVGDTSSGLFRCRKTAAGTYVVYRLS